MRKVLYLILCQTIHSKSHLCYATHCPWTYSRSHCPFWPGLSQRNLSPWFFSSSLWFLWLHSPLPAPPSAWLFLGLLSLVSFGQWPNKSPHLLQCAGQSRTPVTFPVQAAMSPMWSCRHLLPAGLAHPAGRKPRNRIKCSMKECAL